MEKLFDNKESPSNSNSNSISNKNNPSEKNSETFGKDENKANKAIKTSRSPAQGLLGKNEILKSKKI